jgi:hypothetical protein
MMIISLTCCAAQNFAPSIMRSLALLPAQKIFAPLRLYRQRKNTSLFLH